ncbi:MAG: hypothetical protein AAGB16_06185, partial [Pseudomonadota bacterium]
MSEPFSLCLHQTALTLRRQCLQSGLLPKSRVSGKQRAMSESTDPFRGKKTFGRRGGRPLSGRQKKLWET